MELFSLSLRLFHGMIIFPQPSKGYATKSPTPVGVPEIPGQNSDIVDNRNHPSSADGFYYGITLPPVLLGYKITTPNGVKLRHC